MSLTRLAGFKYSIRNVSWLWVHILITNHFILPNRKNKFSFIFLSKHNFSNCGNQVVSLTDIALIYCNRLHYETHRSDKTILGRDGSEKLFLASSLVIQEIKVVILQYWVLFGRTINFNGKHLTLFKIMHLPCFEFR